MWAELQAGTIGDNWFPEYSLNLMDPDGIYPIQTYNVFADGPNFLIQVMMDPEVLIGAYNKNGRLVEEDTIPELLLPLTNPVGTPYLITIYGKVDGDWTWIDGRWFNFIKSMSGTWHGGTCAEEGSEPYRWQLKLKQTPDGKVTGNVYFHACPGGGAVFYSLSGKQVPGDSTVTLNGTKTGGRGGLGGSANQVTFTFGLETSLSPNFAP